MPRIRADTPPLVPQHSSGGLLPQAEGRQGCLGSPRGGGSAPAEGRQGGLGSPRGADSPLAAGAESPPTSELPSTEAERRQGGLASARGEDSLLAARVESPSTYELPPVPSPCRSPGKWPSLEVTNRDFLALLLEQQAEHQRCIGSLLEAHRAQVLEVLRRELASGRAGTSPTARRSFQQNVPGELSAEQARGPKRSLLKEQAMADPGAAAIYGSADVSPASGKAVIFEDGASSTSSGFNFAATCSSTGRRVYSMKSLAEGQNGADIEAVLNIGASKVLEHSFSSCAARLVQSVAFEYAVCVVVLLNAVSIGVHANWAIKVLPAPDDEPLPFVVIDLIFAGIFIVELMLRFMGEGWHFLARENRSLPWNVMDMVLVASAIVEEVLTLLHLSVPNLSIMRLLRILRMVRVVRIFRVTRFFNDLRLIVMALMCAARSLFWVVILLLFVMYIFAVFFMEITASSSISGTSADDEIFQYIGSLEVTMYTLYKSVSGGLEWGPAADHLAKRGAILTILYAVYIAFATLCILNVVTGIFVQNTSTIAHTDQIEMGLEHLERRRVWMNEVVELFNLGDAEGSGVIDWPRFRALVSQPSVQACFQKLGINLECINTRGLFCLFDADNDGKIRLEEFARGVMKLHGTARALDLQLVENDSKRILHYVQMLTKREQF